MIFVSTTCFDFDFLENPSFALDNEILNIELSGGGKFYDSLFLQKQLRIFLSKKETHIKFHNYFPIPEKSFIMNFASSDEQILQNSFILAEKALDLCREFNLPYYSFHPGYLAQGGSANSKGHFDFENNSFVDYDTAFHVFLKNFIRLYELAVARCVKLAVENLFPKFGKIDSLNNTFEDFDMILSKLPEDVAILLDLGHLNVSSIALGFDRFDYLNKMVDKYGERIFEIHISGNDGSDDQHLPIQKNDWQLDALELLKGLPGPSGSGVEITLEARKLDINKINELTVLINEKLGEI